MEMIKVLFWSICMEIVPKLWDDARPREKFTLHFRILKWRTLWCKMRKVFDRTLFSSPFFTSQGSVLKKSQRNVAELKGDKTLYIRCNFKTSQNGARHKFLGAALHPKCAKKVRITLCKMLQFGLRKCNFRSPIWQQTCFILTKVHEIILAILGT